MNAYKRHIINLRHSVRDVLKILDDLASDAITFLVDDDHQLIGAITDGDIRRGIIKGLSLDDDIVKYTQSNPKYFKLKDYSLEQLVTWRNKNFKIIPVVDEDRRIIDIINFRIQKSFLPIDAVIMAGGKGTRLRPMTLTTPKPLLRINDKPIIEYNIDRLKSYGIKNQTISISYLGEQLVDYFKDGKEKGINMGYVEEDKPLGTIGAVRRVAHFYNDYILVMNSDLLTNIDFEDMFKSMIDNDADMIVATTPYEVEIPYGVIETDGDRITALKEKPTYTYYSNAGIYIFKKEYIDTIPLDEHFNATDLMEALYTTDKKVIHFPITGYWLDIGKMHDFEKAQKDIKHIKF